MSFLYLSKCILCASRVGVSCLKVCVDVLEALVVLSESVNQCCVLSKFKFVFSSDVVLYL